LERNKINQKERKYIEKKEKKSEKTKVNRKERKEIRKKTEQSSHQNE